MKKWIPTVGKYFWRSDAIRAIKKMLKESEAGNE